MTLLIPRTALALFVVTGVVSLAARADEVLPEPPVSIEHRELTYAGRSRLTLGVEGLANDSSALVGYATLSYAYFPAEWFSFGFTGAWAGLGQLSAAPVPVSSTVEVVRSTPQWDADLSLTFRPLYGKFLIGGVVAHASLGFELAPTILSVVQANADGQRTLLLPAGRGGLILEFGLGRAATLGFTVADLVYYENVAGFGPQAVQASGLWRNQLLVGLQLGLLLPVEPAGAQGHPVDRRWVHDWTDDARAASDLMTTDQVVTSLQRAAAVDHSQLTPSVWVGTTGLLLAAVAGSLAGVFFSQETATANQYTAVTAQTGADAAGLRKQASTQQLEAIVSFGVALAGLTTTVVAWSLPWREER